MIMAGIGVTQLLISLTLPAHCEVDERERTDTHLQSQPALQKVRRNMEEVYEAVKLPAIHNVLLFFLLGGILGPTFNQFAYSFMIDVAHITKVQIAMFGVISKGCHILGTMYYKKYLKHVETRTVIFWSTVIAVFSTFFNFCFAMRWNVLIGVSDLFFLIFTDVVFGCLSLAMNTLPTHALIAKICPPGIEGTIFALLTGTSNFAMSVLAPGMGAYINRHFVGVTADDLSNYNLLTLAAFVFTFVQFILIPLIPLKQ
jgi:MFS-type transporter involved in bile tolerance (Atg22 family)